MALTEPDLLRNQLRDAIIIDGSDAEALFDSSAPSDVSETSQPPKKCKVPNLGTVLVELFSYKTVCMLIFEIGNSKPGNPQSFRSRACKDKRAGRKSAILACGND
ncbi:uncharacterized protein PADG_04253 [Paracoccidioides brasiliensis Pb18]|uniref:Uncharacterized protein n=1 Tax=Paracoccidioides brasiliensis (strain Pb18) TaxID=502780 RepID=C1GAG7_PARBD|nr:uncharacterized protein PADG_04253 [Paracoccidioides brasiliensis Pb18]EEH48169.2 hypothetical protein PADG_04253 [Paracoccidioides brasiliensis Pb18]